MNVPSNYPSPDQENVYYSVHSLKNKLLSYFDETVVSDIILVLQDFVLPVFVLDDSNTPSSYLITVYSRDSTVQTKMINSTGNIVQSLDVKPVPAAKVESNIVDGGSAVVLDNSFHSTNSIRNNEFTLELSIDTEQTKILNDQPYEMELLLATKYLHEPSVIQERNRYLSISRNILSEQLRNMPVPEFEKLLEEYKNVNVEIDAIVQLLSDSKQGKKESVDSLNFAIAAKNIFKESYDGGGVVATRLQVAQAMSSLANVFDSDKLLLPLELVSKDTTALQSNLSFEDGYQKVWNKFVIALAKNGKIEIPSTDIPSSGEINTVTGSLGNILRFTHNSVTKETFKEDGWIADWYEDNFARKTKDEDTSFESLDAFLDLYKDTVSQAKRPAELIATKGNGLLVLQAILKAIISLCQSNLDVTEHAPKNSKGQSIFASCWRSSVLGPVGCHQYPSKYSDEVDEVTKATLGDYTKTGFLSYGALLQISKKLFAAPSALAYVKENVKSYNSDHDRVINLWKCICDYGIEKKTVYYKPKTNSTEKGPVSTKSAAHLYLKGEKFSEDKPLIVGKTDEVISSQFRAFASWNIPLNVCAHPAYWNSDSLRSVMEFPEITTCSFARSRNGAGLQTHNLSKAFKLIGYQKGLGGGTPITKRSKKGHYGIIDKNKWESSDVGNNLFEFFEIKSYGAPYFWGSIVSIYRALFIEVYRNLLDSIEEILDVEIELSYDEFLEIFDVESVFDVIGILINELIKLSDVNLSCFVGPNGCISITENLSGNVDKSFGQLENTNFLNTSGTIATELLNSYINLVSLASPDAKVSVVSELEELEFDFGTYIPPQSLQIESNTNWNMQHGGNSNFISAEFSTYKNSLQISSLEIKNRLPQGKPDFIKPTQVILELPYEKYISNFSLTYSTIEFLEFIETSFGKFKSFIDGITISETIKTTYDEGHFDPTQGLENPDLLLAQIQKNRNKLSADYDGISKFYKTLKLSDKLEKYKNHYIYVIGLRGHAWDNINSPVVVYPEFMDGNQELESKFEFQYFEPQSNETLTNSELVSKEILNYLHLVRGIYLDPIGFSEKSSLMYSESVVKNESGTFPWVEDDFEESNPKGPVDSIFNMSPYVFPRNYFYDVCLANKYHRIVAVYLSPDDLRSIGYEDEFIGSIRWRIGEKDG